MERKKSKLIFAGKNRFITEEWVTLFVEHVRNFRREANFEKKYPKCIKLLSIKK